MGFFNNASNFTIKDATMNDVGGDYITNNNTTNDSRNNCNNWNKSTVKGSYNNHSKRVVAGGNTTNNNNGGGLFYQANGAQNINAPPPVSQARQGRARQTAAARSPRTATGPANLAARGGAPPRQAIGQRPHNPTYAIPQPPPTRENQPKYTPAPTNLFARDSRSYSDQPHAGTRPSFFPIQSTPNFGDDDDERTWASEEEYEDVDVDDDAQPFGNRPLNS
ncbi:hypothetical protein PTI98_012429 [Pleurotus ostreatus]|nr:hypothetical protein PTI98_012429 [Pleurotus ostreatus]